MADLLRQPHAVEAGPDLEGLAEFVADKDRNEPVRFAGREVEIHRLKETVGRAKARRAGLTEVITAAPGAGKTALLRELARRFQDMKTARVVELDPEVFSEPARAMKLFLKQLDATAARKVDEITTDTVSGGMEVSAGVPGMASVSGGGLSAHSIRRTHLPTRFEEAFELLQDQDTPVAVLVDEVQNWGADMTVEGRDISSLLSEIHQNKKRLPLLLIAAGLGDAKEVLSRRGASRMATEADPLVLGSLSDNEMREVVEAFFEKFRFEAGELELTQWMDAIITETSSWPRHLTNALRGAAEVLLENGGDLSQSSLIAAVEKGSAYRNQYYLEQVGSFVGMPQLLSAVYGSIPKETGATRYAIQKAIDQAYEEHPELADEIPKRDVFTRLLHQGLIQDYGQDRYDCPIPSLRHYVEEFCKDRGFTFNGTTLDLEEESNRNDPAP